MLHLQAFPLLQLLAGVVREGAELHEWWSLSLRRITEGAVGIPHGNVFGPPSFIFQDWQILKAYRLSTLRFLVNSCTMLYGLCTS